MRDLASLCLLVCLIGCSDKQTQETLPIFDVRPSACQPGEGDAPTLCGQILLSQIPVGEEGLRRVELVNLGAGALKIQALRLEDRSSAKELELLQARADGALEAAPSSATLAQGEVLALVVRYRPTDEDADGDEGDVRLATNDPRAREARIPISTGGSGPELRLRPSTLDFGAVDAGEEATREVTLSNSGVATLHISKMLINGSQDFRGLHEGAALEDVAYPLEIASGESRAVTLIYAPNATGADEGELQIESDDPHAPITKLPLTANGAEACLRLSPSVLDFSAALRVDDPSAPTPNQRALSVQSCGRSVLKVSRVEFEPDGPLFGLIDEAAVPLTLPASTPGEALPSDELLVGFWPTTLGAVGGRMIIHSNAPDSPHSVDIFGRGVDNACPIPDVSQAIYDVEPLDQIVLDGGPSMDPGGEVKQWRWSVVERPDGSVSIPFERFTEPRYPAEGGDPDDPETPTAVFFVDLAGHYTLELSVVDNLGQPSCPPLAVARVEINAIPSKDLHIQLVWSTPDDPDETDGSGTDVDLHLKHPNAADLWGEAAGGWDCYFANTGPDWGVAGDVVDNPTLDIDDRNGAGPENINL
ncbi:choice-of-anchor D domain-containing protein, partial [Myxococcota bacterium]|nr:choice-of-anchor D domain-containing protein [Myxococcota bacterium]